MIARKVLIVGNLRGGARAAAERATRQAGVLYVVVRDVDEALGLIHEHNWLALLIDLTSRGIASFCQQASGLRPLLHVPIVALVPRLGELAFSSAFRLGVDDVVSLSKPSAVALRLQNAPRGYIAASTVSKGEAVIADPSRGRCQVLGRVLTSAGFNVRLTTDAESAERYARNPSVQLYVLNAELCTPRTILNARGANSPARAFLIVARQAEVAATRRSLSDQKGVEVMSSLEPPQNLLFLLYRMGTPVGQQAGNSATVHGAMVAFGVAKHRMSRVGFTFTVSPHSIYVRTLAPPQVGTVWLELYPPNSSQRVRLRAEVTWSRKIDDRGAELAPPGFGAKIVASEDGDFQAWRAALSNWHPDAAEAPFGVIEKATSTRTLAETAQRRAPGTAPRPPAKPPRGVARRASANSGVHSLDSAHERGKPPGSGHAVPHAAPRFSGATVTASGEHAGLSAMKVARAGPQASLQRTQLGALAPSEPGGKPQQPATAFAEPSQVPPQRGAHRRGPMGRRLPPPPNKRAVHLPSATQSLTSPLRKQHPQKPTLATKRDETTSSKGPPSSRSEGTSRRVSSLRLTEARGTNTARAPEAQGLPNDGTRSATPAGRTSPPLPAEAQLPTPARARHTPLGYSKTETRRKVDRAVATAQVHGGSSPVKLASKDGALLKVVLCLGCLGVAAALLTTLGQVSGPEEDGATNSHTVAHRLEAAPAPDALPESSNGPAAIRPAETTGVAVDAQDTATAPIETAMPPPESTTPAASPKPKRPPPDAPKRWLRPDRAWLWIASDTESTVFVHGVAFGATNEWIETRCGIRFVRLGAAPGHWHSAGQPTVIKCGKTNVVELNAQP